MQQNQLEKIPAQLPAMSPDEKQVYNAMQGKKIRESEHATLQQQMTDIVSKTFLELGQRKEMADVVFIAEEIINELKNYFPHYSLDEVKLIIHRGTRKYYGDFMGFNPATFGQWLLKYSQSGERESVNKKIYHATQAIEQKSTVSEDEQTKILEEAAKNCFNRYAAQKGLVDLGNVVYDFLDKKKEIHFTTDQKKKFYADAKKKMLAHMKERAAAGAVNRIDIIKHIGEIEAVAVDDRVVIEAKRIALAKHFDKIIKSEKKK